MRDTEGFLESGKEEKDGFIVLSCRGLFRHR